MPYFTTYLIIIKINIFLLSQMNEQFNSNQMSLDEEKTPNRSDLDESQRYLAPGIQNEVITRRKYASDNFQITGQSKNDFSGNDQLIIKSIIKDANPNKIKITTNDNQRQIVFEIDQSQQSNNTQKISYNDEKEIQDKTDNHDDEYNKNKEISHILKESPNKPNDKSKSFAQKI